MKYNATFVVKKSFEVEVAFEAPSAEIAEEMANDMAQDDNFDFGDGEEFEVETRLDYDPVEVDQTVRVTRSVQRWCDEWLKDREEDKDDEAIHENTDNLQSF